MILNNNINKNKYLIKINRNYSEIYNNCQTQATVKLMTNNNFQIKITFTNSIQNKFHIIYCSNNFKINK